MSILKEINNSRILYVNMIREGREIYNEDLNEYLFAPRLIFPRVNLTSDELFKDLCYIFTKISDYQRNLVKTWLNDFPNDISWYSKTYINCIRYMSDPIIYMLSIKSLYNNLSDECKKYFLEYFKNYYRKQENFFEHLKFLAEYVKNEDKHKKSINFLKEQFCFP